MGAPIQVIDPDGNRVMAACLRFEAALHRGNNCWRVRIAGTVEVNNGDAGGFDQRTNVYSLFLDDADNEPTGMKLWVDSETEPSNFQTFEHPYEYQFHADPGPHTLHAKVQFADTSTQSADYDWSIYGLAINDGAAVTSSTSVTLNNYWPGSPTHYMASEDINLEGATWQAYSTAPAFTLSASPGLKTVYMRVKYSDGEKSTKVEDSIMLSTSYEAAYTADTGTSSDALYEANIDGTGESQLAGSYPQGSTQGVAVDSENDVVWWSVSGNGITTIPKGGGSQTNVTLSEASKIVLDVASQQAYFMLAGDTVIKRIDFDGSNETDLITLASGFFLVKSALAIAFDLDGGKIYYGVEDTNPVTDEFYLYRADLDGSNQTQLLDLGPQVGSTRRIAGLAIREQQNRLYLADDYAVTIDEYDLNGNFIRSVIDDSAFSANPGIDYVEVEETAGKIYWCMDGDVNVIRWADLDGTSKATWLNRRGEAIAFG